MHEPPQLLVVDDTPANIRLLEAILTSQGYAVVAAESGERALEIVAADPPDLVLLDLRMPGIDGLEVCRRLRADDATRGLPIIMITAHGDNDRVQGLEAGADDFLPKPFNQAEMLARVRSLLRIKGYADTIAAQAGELEKWGHTLEERVATQVEELEQLGRLRRFLSPQLADTIVSSADTRLLEPHRRKIAVLFVDLRGFTSFAASAEPEEVMQVLGAYYEAIGLLVRELEATVGDFAGDGVMVYFNDPIPCPDAPARAVRMGLALRERMEALKVGWHKRGWDIGFGIGIATGYATLGTIGFADRLDYKPVGTVVNIGSRLCSEAADGEVLVNQGILADVEDLVDAEPSKQYTLKGFVRPVTACNVRGLRPAAGTA